MRERNKLIKQYKKLACKYDEIDSFEIDILPKLETMSTDEIKKQYEIDKKYWSNREYMLMV